MKTDVDKIPATDRDPAMGAVLRGYATDELDIAIDCLSWRGARIHAGVHQARKSLRRTRATLALAGSAIGPGATLIERELRRINRRLSSLRDAQALVDTLEHLAQMHTSPEQSALLQRARRIAVASRREQARAAMREDPHFTGQRSVLLLLRAGLQTLPWSAVSERTVAAATRTSLSREKSASAKARTSGRMDAWHRWRRRARRLSQQHRALQKAAASIPVANDGAKKLTALLGQAQDYAMLALHCRSDALFADADRAALRALARKELKRLRARIIEVSAGRRAD